MMRRFARIGRGDDAAFAELDDEVVWLLDRPPYLTGSARTGESLPLAKAELLPPVTPTKIVCVGRNYRAHAEELGNTVPSEPLLFLKPPSSLLAPHGNIVLPPQSQRVEHEVELGVVMRNAQEIFGYTIVGDITARDLQRGDKTWTRGKGFDTFCPAGPFVVSDIDVSAVDIDCDVNGEPRQRGNTEQMVFAPAELIAYINSIMTLSPGDLIATGTPAGVGPLAPGDAVSMRIEHLGELTLGVVVR